MKCVKWWRPHKFDKWKADEHRVRLDTQRPEAPPIGVMLLQRRTCETCGYMEIDKQEFLA